MFLGWIGFKKKHINYHEYIKSEKWRRKAKACYKRAGYRCQICAATNRRLEAHHNTYNNLGNEKSEDLICVCDLCHQGITEMLRSRNR